MKPEREREREREQPSNISPPWKTTSTIKYDGTSWAASASMATARGYNSGSAGLGSSGIFTVGDFPASNSTEESSGWKLWKKPEWMKKKN